MTIDEAREVHRRLTKKDKLDEIAAHACGSASAAILALEALGVALAERDEYARGCRNANDRLKRVLQGRE